MELQEIAVVLLADLISGKDDDILGIVSLDKGNVLIDCVGRDLVPVGAAGFLVRRQHMYAAVETVKVPGLAVSDVLIQHKGLILGQDADCIDSGVDTVGKGEIDDAVFPAKRNCRFCKLLCQSIQTGALSAGKKHCNHFFCHIIPS